MDGFITIHGVQIKFHHRDIKLVNDFEYRELERFVDDEIRRTNGRVDTIVITTDHIREGCRYVVTTTHEEHDDGGETELPDREDDR